MDACGRENMKGLVYGVKHTHHELLNQVHWQFHLHRSDSCRDDASEYTAFNHLNGLDNKRKFNDTPKGLVLSF